MKGRFLIQFGQLLASLLCLQTWCFAQTEQFPRTDIKTVKLFPNGNQASVALVRLGEQNALELHFDDLSGRPKNYYYTYELRNADWSQVDLSQMDYLKGFTQNRITQYRLASSTFTKYVHYQASLPDRNCMPSRSGNYFLKVFENGDTSKLLFTKRLLVVDDKIKIGLNVRQPFSGNTNLTHQKIIANINIGSLDIYNPAQQVKLVILQNNRWDIAQSADVPTFIRNNQYEYNVEDNFIFEGGKEWRWVDLRSFRFQSDRVASVNYGQKSYDVYVRPDSVRPRISYRYYPDNNGMYVVSVMESINPWWQGDYGNIHFGFNPGNAGAFANYDLFLMGQLTGYTSAMATKMEYNENLGLYETNLLLKNGYYNYAYGVKPKNNPKAPLSIIPTEGSVWNAENQYLALFYYKSFGGRADELIGYGQVSSLSFLNNN